MAEPNPKVVKAFQIGCGCLGIIIFLIGAGGLLLIQCARHM